MFGKNKKPPENSATQSFLNAQAERLDRKYNRVNQPIESTLGEIVDDSPKPINTGEIINVLEIEGKDEFVKEHVVGLMKLINLGFNEARAAGKRYDPLDDQTFVGHEGYDAMSESEKELTLNYLSNYLSSLEREYGKPLQYRSMGRHALNSAQISQQASASAPIESSSNV